MNDLVFALNPYTRDFTGSATLVLLLWKAMLVMLFETSPNYLFMYLLRWCSLAFTWVMATSCTVESSHMILGIRTC